MCQLQKLRNNILSTSALSALGASNYARYLATFAFKLNEIRSAGDFKPLDQAMGKTVSEFRYRGSRFFFDCRFCDEQLNEASFGFGLAREIYIRDCYFRWQPAAIYRQAATVVDLGANRGAFSSLMTTKAKKIISVECQQQYVPIIQHNMRLNQFDDCATETALIGSGGSSGDSASPRLTVEQLLDRHQMKVVDFLKLDIEGSEFALFESPQWLGRVKAMSMEVHPRFGDTTMILDCLTKHGFEYALADANVVKVESAKLANFIYAWKGVSR